MMETAGEKIKGNLAEEGNDFKSVEARQGEAGEALVLKFDLARTRIYAREGT